MGRGILLPKLRVTMALGKVFQTMIVVDFDDGPRRLSFYWTGDILCSFSAVVPVALHSGVEWTEPHHSSCTSTTESPTTEIGSMMALFGSFLALQQGLQYSKVALRCDSSFR